MRIHQLLFRRWTAVLAAAAIGLLTLASGSGIAIDRLLAVARDSIRTHPASGRVQIIDIDAKSLASIAEWPWPRTVHAEIIDRLSRAGARSIVFDVDFSSTSNPAHDARLGAALDRAGGKVILPTFRQRASAADSRFIDALPIDPLRDKAFLAVVNVTPDSDGYVRRMPLGLRTDGVPRPSLAAMIAEANAAIDQDFDIDFAIDPKTIPRHSVVDLIEGRVPASALKGQRVVIGASAVEMGDRYAVPGHGVLPGVLIQAMAAETLMQGPLPQRWSGLWSLALVLLLIVIALQPRRRGARIALLGGTLTVLLALPLVAVQWFAVTLPIAPALAALATAAAIRGAGWIVESFVRRAHCDLATGLPNLAALVSETRWSGELRIVVARIEGLAIIASTLGPDRTALFVQRVAERLRDVAEEAPVYRTDDAALAWVESGSPAEFEARLERAVARMRHPIECGRMIDASIHFGIAAGIGVCAKQLVADALLAATKASVEGDSWARFDDAVGNEADRQVTLLGEIDSAIRLGQIWNAYQPKLDIASGRIVGAEALVRWDHPERGLIRPDLFIPVFEKAGRIRDLTLHVLRQAQDDALEWRRLGHELNVAVNVSANLLADHEFIEIVRQALQSHRLPAHCLTLEMTESAAMASPKNAIAALESWRSLGVHISIDDYGTGQSSLGYLQKLPATELKIDRSFVQPVATDVRNAAMVRSTISLAHELGMTAVAEGVEDFECLAALTSMGCDKAQGYFIGRPMSSDAFIAMIANDFKLVA